ncbi:MAG TPA: DinB family protein [Phycisphaerae bacterium]|nr:DinB family protein [Phycisphaerales bacterium]HRX85043.1 DinB family protein [Phycisphaerae bacterium]
MSEYLNEILLSQYEAVLGMLHDSLTVCPDAHWDEPVGKYPFWQVAYHTLCFTDLYLTPDEKQFEPGERHPAGWQEFDDEYPSRRFDRDELVAYALACRDKARTNLAAETPATLAGPSGHARRDFSRGELHIYNIRHIQHHTGQLQAFIRRIGPEFQELGMLKWGRSGWPENGPI